MSESPSSPVIRANWGWNPKVAGSWGQVLQGSGLAAALLFLWGFSLGLPDVAYEVYEVVNVRLDDLLILIMLLFLPVLPQTAWQYTPGQKKYILILLPLIAFCFLSAFVSFLGGTIPSLYRLAQLVGITATFAALPLFIRDDTGVKALLLGMVAGGLVYLASNFSMILLAGYEPRYYRELKEVLSPETWNPNTIGNMAVTWATFAFLGASSVFRSRWLKLLFLLAGAVFAVIPFFLFTRGATIGITLILTLILLLRKDKYSLLALLLMAFIAWNIYGGLYSPKVAEEAVVDLERDMGLRFFMYEAAFKGLLEHPLGIGFGNEPAFLYDAIRYYSSHNVFLASYLELGLFGGTLFLVSIFFFPWVFARLLNKEGNRTGVAAYLFSLSVGLIVMGLAAPGFYFEKPGSPVFAVFLGLLGWLERKGEGTPAALSEERQGPMAPAAYS